MSVYDEQMSSKSDQNPKDIVNPIDKDKIAEMPSLLEYAHTIGSALIKPEDTGKIKGRALKAMHEQTGMQMGKLYEQMQLLAHQAKEIQDRVLVSERIYQAKIGFEPIVSHTYYLYQKGGRDVLSMVAPEEWGGSLPFDGLVASVKLLGDHTWDILEKGDIDLD